MNPPTDQPVMTLEETLKGLHEDSKLCDADISFAVDDEDERQCKLRKRLVDSALHHLEAGKRENERLTRCLAYLTECSAATALDMPKSLAKGQKDRFVSIVKSSLSFCLGGFPRDHGADVKTLLQSAIDRCNKVAAPTPPEQKEKLGWVRTLIANPS